MHLSLFMVVYLLTDKKVCSWGVENHIAGFLRCEGEEKARGETSSWSVRGNPLVLAVNVHCIPYIWESQSQRGRLLPGQSEVTNPLSVGHCSLYIVHCECALHSQLLVS